MEAGEILVGCGLLDERQLSMSRVQNHDDVVEAAVELGFVTEEAALPHFKALWAERGVEEACLAGWMDLNAQWKEGAAAVGIPSVDFVAAWNGPDGAGDAPREYFVGDGGHLSQQGARAAADVLREAGYGPLVQ